MLTLFDQARVWDMEKKNIKNEGKEEGRAEEKNNMIMSMLYAGISVEKIAEIAKTTTENVKEICKLQH